MVAHIESVDTQWTFTIELLQDWGASGSLFEAMWTDAEAAPNTTLAVSATFELAQFHSLSMYCQSSQLLVELLLEHLPILGR
jgi:hypothetical protein